MSGVSVQDKLRLSHVKRWHMVNTAVTQTVADHSWRVAIIAMEICSRFGLTDMVAVKAALLHDIDEIWSGDIPGHTKAEKAMPPELSPAWVVKWADMIEGYTFIARHHVDSHGEAVKQHLGNKIASLISDLDEDLAEVIIDLTDEIKNGDIKLWA